MLVWDQFQHGFEWFALHGDGYQFWSGIGSGSPLIVGAIVVWRRHNCHVRWCPRIIWRTHGEHELCRRHHPASPPSPADLEAG